MADSQGAPKRSFVSRVYTFRASDQAVHPTTRLAGFTDAILAIASTVLVLNLTVRAEQTGGTLSHQIAAQRPALLSVLLGFVWIVGAWVLSHRALRQLRGVDHYMTLYVVAGTLSITLIPFATLLLANGYGHPDFWIGTEAVSLVVLIGTVLSALGTDYAHRRGLLVPGTDPSQRAAALTIWYAVLALVVLAAILAPFVPWASLAIVIVTRVSALLPLGSDRAGYAGDPDAER
ncbi:MAG TPA: TMEM175 family protein [Acidimicrobiales bacterium]|nr:TMEM175 family protein [Acidimicrobiales bacterium]